VRLRACLIANRGEIAVRIIRACRELGIRAVAVYSEVDAGAEHVRLADQAFLIGGPAAADSYLNIPRLIEAAQAADCDCVHPGYGFLSESEQFARAVQEAGLVWVGPPPDAIEAMGVKTTARAIMEAAGVPLVPGFQSETAQDELMADAAAYIGYPIMVKAAGGGGGKGIRVVYTPDELYPALDSARREAQNAFGDARIFLEKFIEQGRHIEVQIAADRYGRAVHLFERDCSAQRRHQKVIEETPAPHLDAELRQLIGESAVNAALAVGYVNVGTVEFILDADGQFYFLEMNTRLQVEHPVTELVTGIDLVRLQFSIAQGDPLPFQQRDLHQRGHAIEARLYAEDPETGFLPSTGTITLFRPPAAPGVRVDSGVVSGNTIGIHYDPLIAKIIVWDTTREDALRRMAQALRETVVLGTTTNLRFLRALIAHPRFAAGGIDTHFIDDYLPELIPPAEPLPLAALIAAALLESGMEASAPPGVAASLLQHDPWSARDSFRLGGQP
jgi:acetyl-CoA carboxylase biotin carboxylase subunit